MCEIEGLVLYAAMRSSSGSKFDAKQTGVDWRSYRYIPHTPCQGLIFEMEYPVADFNFFHAPLPVLC